MSRTPIRDALPSFPHAYREVVRLENATTVDIERFLERDEPVVMPDGLAKTPFFDQLLSSPDERATLAMLTNTFGEREITATRVPAQGRLPGGDKPLEKMPFREFTRELADQLDRDSPTRVYMQNHSIGRFPEIAWQPPAITHRDWEQSHTGLWIGPGGQIVNFHYDNSYNFMCMLAGCKRVALLPFDVLPDVYPVFDAPTNVTWSSVRLLEPDFARYPRFRDALAQLRVVTLQRGDVLLIPPHWWHHVESFGLNIMISNWGSTFPLKIWRAIGRVRVEALMLFNDLTPRSCKAYAARWDQQVFRNPRAQTEQVDGELDAEPVARERLDKNLAEAAALFERVPEVWRRHGQLAFHYFVFQTYGTPSSHEAGAHEALIDQLKRKLARGEVVSPLG
jgi:hypothetical protein